MNVELVKQKFEASWTSYAAMLGNGGSVSAADLCMVRRLILRLVPLIYADHEKEGDYPSYLGFRIVDAAGRDDFAATALTFARLEAGKKYGIGMPSGGRRSGLNNIAHRAEARGGQLTLNSDRSGTAARWSVPLGDERNGEEG